MAVVGCVTLSKPASLSVPPPPTLKWGHRQSPLEARVGDQAQVERSGTGLSSQVTISVVTNFLSKAPTRHWTLGPRGVRTGAPWADEG